MGIPREEAPMLPIPLHTLIKLQPDVYSCAEERVQLTTKSVRFGPSSEQKQASAPLASAMTPKPSTHCPSSQPQVRISTAEHPIQN